MLVVIAAGAAWSMRLTRSEREQEVRTEASSMSAIAAAYLNQYLDSLDAIAAVLAHHPAVVALDPVESSRAFEEILRTQPLLLNVILRGADGSIRGSGVPLSDDAIAAPLPPFSAAVLVSGQPVSSDLYRGPVGRLTLARAYPVRGRTGAVIGVLGLGLDVARLQEVFARVELPEGSALTLFDSAGRVISRSPGSEEVPGTSEPGVPGPPGEAVLRTGHDGVRRFYGDSRLQRGGWIVAVGIPEAEVFRRLAPLWRRNVAMTGASVLIVLGLALSLAGVTTRGLNQLRAAAQRIADGDLSPPAAEPAPSFEIAQLQDAFRTMAARLRDARSALDEQIEQERRMRGVLESLQMQVVRQERLAAVGLLVSGVAHELNNPLQGILGTAELLERQTDLPPDVRDEIVFIKTQSGRAREIIRNLSRFSRQQPEPPAFIDLADVVTEVIHLRRRDLEKAAIALDVCAASHRKVLANVTEIEQVVLNFVINAQQAIESTGRNGGRIRIEISDSGRRVRLAVADDGPGVRPDDESKLFQPFFTTKPVGIGTGLGLSVSYGIVESYGGAIGHRPNEWGGATFFFELPAADPEADAPA